MTDDFLDRVRVAGEQGRRVLNPAALDALAALQQTMNGIRALARQKPVQIRFSEIMQPSVAYTFEVDHSLPYRCAILHESHRARVVEEIESLPAGARHLWAIYPEEPTG